ncbi:MAG: hypothetical protein JO057_00995 [Chloroflexi bacterium]|nr:hypothetical protein [Chloroflexota bacterium]
MNTHHSHAIAPDDWFMEHPRLSEFVATARELIDASAGDVPGLLGALDVPFRDLLADQFWLAPQFGIGCETGGMGGGIGQWLLFRSGDHSLTLFSLVVPPGSATPVHDHHAWGLVGLYRGEQAEDVYRRDTAMPDPAGRAPLTLVEQRTVNPGDMYRLLPPSDDVHAVRTTSTVPSVSIHLLGIDAGCVWRHRFEPDHARALPFRSGYSNEPCADADAQPPERITCAPAAAPQSA